ncbi:ATP-grasp domain-containing protein [Flavobacterium humi]|uniref:D-alanine--D-alanine ligase n=1 Tax=Flavobacterium humi TaxID=2562683 RepID=A0A4Z0LCR9_9FLAO|nr:D-alanine--D-alanine ligase [Flavobacterium humi]TGD59667.1 D-alanine--D-alanine ligase [Flavobacterium humi]
MRLFLHKLAHWEYWPFTIVYIPIYFLWAYYALKAKTIFFFNASNPGMKNGGFIMDSKKEIYDLIPKKYYPATELVKEGTSFAAVKTVLEESTIVFPLIAKPDIGLRGSAVKKIHTIEELEQYHDKANFDYLLQELIPYENEIGIFYVRFPHEDKGRLTGIVSKEYLTVTGDGISSIRELLQKNKRHALQLKALEKEYKEALSKVLDKGELKNLVPYGNHCRGTKFTDASHLISPKLQETINEMCLQIPGFYFGRMDLMYESLASLEQGKNFALVELNGAASEPTHIYDPAHSIFFAWKELARHISYMFEISIANNKRGIPFLSHKEGMVQYRLHLEQNNKIVHF